MNNGRFKKGNIPWNKGKHTGSNPGSEKTQFRKGCISPNWRPVGSLRKTKDGFTMIKIKNHQPWVLYQRFLYEQHYNCKLKPYDCIRFLDGNRENFKIENLVRVTRRENAVINHENLINRENPELSKAGILIARLKIKSNDLAKQ